MPSSRGKAYDTYRTMAQSSPYRRLTWQYLGPDQHQRPRDRHRRRRASVGPPHLRRLRHQRRVEDRRQRRDAGRRCSRTSRPPASATSPSRRPTPTSSGSAPASRTCSARRCPASASTSRPTAARTFQHIGPDRHADDRAQSLVHPTNPDIVYVAACGHEWTDNETRGVFKTTDGGRTWTKVLYHSPRTGAIDLVMDPSDPEHALCRDVAAGAPQVERPAGRAGLRRERHLEDDRRRQDMDRRRARACRRRSSVAASASTSSRSNPNVLYAFVDNYEDGPAAARRRARRLPAADPREPDQGGGDLSHRRQGPDLAQGEREQRLHDRSTPAPTAGCSARSASIRRTRTPSTRSG